MPHTSFFELAHDLCNQITFVECGATDVIKRESSSITLLRLGLICYLGQEWTFYDMKRLLISHGVSLSVF